jgi:hypothetical protein
MVFILKKPVSDEILNLRCNLKTHERNFLSGNTKTGKPGPTLLFSSTLNFK